MNNLKTEKNLKSIENKDILNYETITSIKDVLHEISSTLIQENGDSILYICNYLISGDPIYITSKDNSRSKICKLERFDIIREMIKEYIEKNI